MYMWGNGRSAHAQFSKIEVDFYVVGLYIGNCGA